MELFTSDAARAAGIHYINQEVKTVAEYITNESKLAPVRVYGNPKQPDFLNMSYAFTYPPYPSPESVAAWSRAPARQEGVNLWIMHSPPVDRLDAINVPGGLIGCVAQYERIAAARPLLCVFGHYHFSWGVERVRWEEDNNRVAGANLLTLSEERKGEQNLGGPPTKSTFSFTGSKPGSLPPLEVGKETLFVNAAWMTMKKRTVEKRNLPIVIELQIP